MAVHTIIVVEGRGQFPIDMLRYDCCYPATSSDASKIALSLSPYHRNRELTRIELVRHGPPTMVTPDRWESFRWKVLKTRRVG